MDGFLQSLSQSGPQILLGVAVVSLVALALALRAMLLLKRQRQRWDAALRGANGESLERLLTDALRENAELHERLAAAEHRLTEVEKHAEKSKRHLGLIRYDAFEDVGGSQSFAMALYDDNGDGAVLNGIVGRTDCRVYCKPLVAGRSDRNLSQEERRAIEEALSRVPKTAVTG